MYQPGQNGLTISYSTRVIVISHRVLLFLQIVPGISQAEFANQFQTFTDSRKNTLTAPSSAVDWSFKLCMDQCSVLTYSNSCVSTALFGNVLFSREEQTVSLLISYLGTGRRCKSTGETTKSTGETTVTDIYSLWLSNQNVTLAARMNNCKKKHTVKHQHSNALAAQDQRCSLGILHMQCTQPVCRSQRLTLTRLQ